jgi:hypothetical protein
MLANAGFVTNLAYQIEPGTLAASLDILSRSGNAIRGISLLRRRRVLLWLISACPAWLRQSGIIVAYAHKRNPA